MTEKVTGFLRGVKQGTIRGDFVRKYYSEDVALELSVGSFEMGYVHVRVFVECPEEDESEGMYYRRLQSVDNRYMELRSEIVDTIEKENETGIENAHEWRIQRTGKSQSLARDDMFPKLLDASETLVFDAHVQIRDDVSMAEAVMTNRNDGMTRDEIEEELDDQN